MKKSLFVIAFCGVTLSSCYNTRLLVGNVDPKEPLLEVNKEWNHHLIGGLVPLENTKMNPAEYVNNAPDYVVKTNRSFLNGLVSTVTFGIYTPSQTKYYIPLKSQE